MLLHSWIRWAVLALLVLVVMRGWQGRRGLWAWSAGNERLHVALVAVADVQLVIGLWLYLGASPFVQAFLSDVGVNIHNRLLRFFGLEHVTMMLVAIACIHIGRARSKSAPDPRQHHRRAFAWTLAALILVLASIPWPFLPVARPLFRFD
ncbi:MAG: hypothetical protein ABIU38_18605 [Vicinamibacteraceae bacterium]